MPSTEALHIVRLPKDGVDRPIFPLTFVRGRGLSPFASSPDQTLFAVRDRVDVLSDDEMAWVGTLRLSPTGDNIVGDATLIYHSDGSVIGQIRAATEVYEIRHLQGPLHALVDLNESVFEGDEGDSPFNKGTAAPDASSASHPHSHPASHPASPAVSAPASADAVNETCTDADAISIGNGVDLFASAPIEEPVSLVSGAVSAPNATTSNATTSAPRCYPYESRILVLWTAAAANGRNASSIASLAVQQANEAYSNSRSSRFRLKIARKQLLSGFNETADAVDDLDRLSTNSTVQSLRNQYRADLVVLMTDSPYYAGRALAIRANASTALAVSDVDRSTQTYPFAHEVGHLQGAQHHPDDFTNPNLGFSYGYGHRFSDKDCTLLIFCSRDRYATVMAYQNGEYSRIKYFSNPNVSYDSKATGIANSRDNARVIRTTALSLMDFRTPNDLNASISQSSSAAPYAGSYTFSTSPCGGSGGYTYKWYRRLSSGSYGSVLSTSSSFSTYLSAGPLTRCSFGPAHDGSRLLVGCQFRERLGEAPRNGSQAGLRLPTSAAPGRAFCSSTWYSPN